MHCSNSAEILSSPHALPFGKSLITCLISCCCCSLLQLTEGKSSSQFPSTAVVRMQPQWDSLVRGPLIRGLTALFHRRFFRDCPVPLGVSSGEMKTKIDCCNFLLFLGRFHLVWSYHQTGYSNETLPNVLQAEVASLLPNPPYVSWLRSQGVVPISLSFDRLFH